MTKNAWPDGLLKETETGVNVRIKYELGCLNIRFRLST